MPVLKATAGGGVKVEPGTYECECIEANQDTIENPQFGSGDVLRVKVRLPGVNNEDGDEVELDAMANLKLTPKSKLWGWIEAFGFKLAIGQDFDTEQLRGKRAYAVVGQREGQDGALWARIEDFVALPKSAQPQKTTADILHFDENGDAVVDWTVMWTLLRKHGITNKHFADNFGEPKEIDPLLLPDMVADLIGRTK